MKYAWINRTREAFALSEMCQTLGASLSGYLARKRGSTPTRQRPTESQTLALIRAIHGELNGAYGFPRTEQELRARGYPTSEERGSS